jgi:lauroyl/myristoyl acyltransferase
MLKMGLSRFLQLRLNFLIFSFVPLSISSTYLLILGWLYYGVFNTGERRKIEKNIETVFRRRLSAAGIRSLARKTISNTFTHYAEKLFQAFYNRRKWINFIRTRVEFNGLESLDRALTEGKGVLLVTGHFGAVEFLPTALAFKGYPPVMMAKFKTEKLREVSLDRAASIGLTIIDCGKQSNPFLTSIKLLKQGKALITECDEIDNWRAFPGKRGSFLGHQVMVDKTIDLMVKKSGCTVLAAFMCRMENGRYSLDLRELSPPLNGETVGERLLKTLEDFIYTHPEQWYHWKKFDAMLADEGIPACESEALPSTALESLYAFE